MCSCGDLCNCLGCPAHPYNEATQNYVRSAVNSMMESPQQPQQTHLPPQAQQPQQIQQTQQAQRVAVGDGYGELSATTDEAGVSKKQAVSQVTAHEPASPQQAHTPSDASGLSEDQTQLSASDFFFVTYPFGQCGGEVMSCPCGDECQCVGCLIHNNPGPDET